MGGKFQAVLFGLLMMTMSLAGCFGSGDSDDELNQPSTGQLDDWQVHFAQSSSDLPVCDQVTNGRLYYVEADMNFQVCTSTGWEIIDVSGSDGSDGRDGADGEDGHSVAVRLVSSNTCPNGGKSFEIGTDIDGDGLLGGDETGILVDICHGERGLEGPRGADGQDGSDGQDGVNGTDGLNALVKTTDEAVGSNCANGGLKIEVGGDDDGDGVLSSSEVDQTQFVCNGAHGTNGTDGLDGQDGADGQDGLDGSASASTLLSSVTTASAAHGCDAGGRVLHHGLDNGDGGGTVQNGILESGEIDYSTIFCRTYTIWQAEDIHSGASGSKPGQNLNVLVGDTMYFYAEDATYGAELWAHNFSNSTTWQVADIRSGYGWSNPGSQLQVLVGDTIYFDAGDGITGVELWAHDTSNHSTWQVADINNGSAGSYPSNWFTRLIGDTIYFDAYNGSGEGIWAHNTSNHTTWLAATVYNGSVSSYPGYSMSIVVGDTLYFDANDGWFGTQMWAHDTSNGSTWKVTNINSPGAAGVGYFFSLLIGDTLYFDAGTDALGNELWAHNTSNHSTWLVADINPYVQNASNSHPGYSMEILVGDTMYFSANDGISGHELWAHDLSNASTWQVADINNGSHRSDPGLNLCVLVGDTIYFDAMNSTTGRELWAHDTSNHSTWLVADISPGAQSSGFVDEGGEVLIDGIIYFGADDGVSGHELWAHDVETGATWLVAAVNPGSVGSQAGSNILHFYGNRLYFDANDGTTGTELWGMHLGSVVVFIA